MYWSRSLIGVNTCSVIMSVTQQISRTLSRQVKCTKCDNPLARLNNRVRLKIPNGFIICQSSTQAECSITIDRDHVDFFSSQTKHTSSAHPSVVVGNSTESYLNVNWSYWKSYSSEV